MATALFISEQYVKDNTIIDENVDAALLRQIILDSQEENILPILGTGLYDDLATEVLAGSVGSANTTLLNNYVQKVLKYHVLAEATDLITYKYRDKGAVKQTGDKTFTVDIEELKRLIAKWENKAELHTQRLINYLCENAADSFPLYLNPGTGVDIIKPKKNPWSTGIYMRGARGGSGPSKAERYENGDIVE